jgi:signal transduction histidine kinase
MNLKFVRKPGGDAGDTEGWFETVLNALADPVLVIDAEGGILHVNLATEQFFDASQSWLCERVLTDIIPADSPVFAMMEQVRAHGASLSEYGVTLDTPRTGSRLVTIQVAPISDTPGAVVLSFHDRSIASKMTRQMDSRNAVRSVIGMAAVLAHEVKNPLSGIRGAAQLLESGVGRPHLRAGRPHGSVFRPPLHRTRPGQHPPGARTRARARSFGLRPPYPVQGTLRSVASRRGGRPRPAHPGVPQPGEERG